MEHIEWVSKKIRGMSSVRGSEGGRMNPTCEFASGQRRVHRDVPHPRGVTECLSSKDRKWLKGKTLPTPESRENSAYEARGGCARSKKMPATVALPAGKWDLGERHRDESAAP